MQQVSVILLHVKVTIFTTESSKVFRTRMRKSEKGRRRAAREGRRGSVKMAASSISKEGDGPDANESKEEMFLEGMCLHYANGVDADQIDVIVGGMNVVDHSTDRVQPKTFLSIKKEISVQPSWGWTPSLMSVLRRREERTAFFKWLETLNTSAPQSRRSYGSTNLKFWIEAEHYRTDRHRFGDVSDPRDYDFNLYRPSRIKWADAILNRYLHKRGANKVELTSREAESAQSAVIREFAEIETWQHANKQPVFRW